MKSTPSLIFTSVGALFILASYGILMGALPAELASRHLTPKQIGLVVGSNALGAFCFRLFALNAIDRVGAAKIASAAAICASAASLCLGAVMLSFHAALALLSLANFIQGAATSAFLTSGYTYCAQAGEPEKRGMRIGLYGSIASIGLLLSPPIGIWLWVPGENFYLWLLPAVLSLPAAFLLPGDHRNRDFKTADGGLERSFLALLSVAVSAPLFALAVSAGIQGGFEAQMPFLVRDFDARAILVELYAFFGISVAAGRFGGGWLADRTGAKRIFFLGLACQTFALMLPLAAPNAIGLLLSSVTFGAGSGMVGTSAIAMLAVAVPAHRSGAVIGLGGVVRDAGFAVGAATTGLMISFGGARAFLWVGVGLTALSFLASAYIYNAKRT